MTAKELIEKTNDTILKIRILSIIKKKVNLLLNLNLYIVCKIQA